MLMVKPGMAYLDVVRKMKDAHPEYPLFIYQVSGEYSMIYHAAKNNVADFKVILMEILTAMRRAGNILILYL